MNTNPIDPSLVFAVHDFIEEAARGEDPGDFDALCLEVAAAQGVLGDESARGLAASRPVPETGFKLMTLAHFPPSEAEATFHTSGTTTGTPGRHLVRDLSLYRLSAVAGFARFVMSGTGPGRFVHLIPPGSARPHSSLSRMVDDVVDSFSTSPAVCARTADAVDLGAALSAFEAAATAREPLFLLATTLDCLALFEGMRATGATIPLPRGSRVMHTGGPKATGRSIAREALREEFGVRLGLAPEDVVEEYGMTELLSQAYDAPRVTPGPRRLVPVPWMRTRVLDPLTMDEVPDGSRGVLCHYDLANIHSAVAVLTGDTATRVRDGFIDIVRAAGAAPRGCSSEAATRWEDR
jgi:hypothetical protein